MIEKLTKQSMPKMNQAVYETYPWGVTLTVSRVWNDSKDLAAQATGFEYQYADSKGVVLKSGKFTAIGGLSGSFQSCYFPSVRRLENRLYEKISIETKYEGEYFSEFREVLVANFLKNCVVVAVTTEDYGNKFFWLDQPIDLGILKINQKSRLNVSNDVYESVINTIPKECLV